MQFTDAITIKKFPKLDRFGEQAVKPNENFLNADLFAKAFLKPCEAVRANIDHDAMSLNRIAVYCLWNSLLLWSV